MPIVSLLLSHVLAHSFISLLLERAVSLPVSHRRLSFSLLRRSPSPRSNRRTESYFSFRDRDASVVVLKQGAAMLSNPGSRRARGFWQADFCAGNASRITIALSYLNLVDVVGYVKVAVSAHVHTNFFLYQQRNQSKLYFKWVIDGQFLIFLSVSSKFLISLQLIPLQLIPRRIYHVYTEECVNQYVAFICVPRQALYTCYLSLLHTLHFYINMWHLVTFLGALSLRWTITWQLRSERYFLGIIR